MILGMVWYGTLFGKKWAEIIGADMHDAKAREEMRKAAGPLYLVQFLLTLFQAWVLAYYLSILNVGSAMGHALWLWAGFVLPTTAGASMWNNEKKHLAWSRFLIQTGYQLTLFVVFGLVLGVWR